MTIIAEVNYVEDPGDGVVPFLLDTDWTGANRLPVAVDMIDGCAQPPSLDREGFVKDRIVSGVTDYSDMEQVERLWMPAAAEMLKRVTGAKWVVTWAANVRFSRRQEASLATSVAAPAPVTHSDLTPNFDVANIGSQPVSQAAAEEMARRLGPGKAPTRWCAFNIWQQISPPPQDTPLALCDLRTVESGDILDARGRINPADEHTFGLTFFQPNPNHRWYYFPDLLPGEALVFSGLNPDPATGPVRGRVPHTAFELPNLPENVIARNSIEVRALAIFEE